jgi:hypothetical protein
MQIFALLSIAILLSSCTPRDFLTRRLAADLIAGSATFRAQQHFQLRTGVVSNQEYLSSDYVVLQHRGWLSAANAPCPASLTASPCWEITLTPSGADTFQILVAPDAGKQSFTIPAARRELIAVTGIARQRDQADVEFTWQWLPLNEVGAVLYSSEVHYRSTVGFRNYDDGWRLIESTPHPAQSLDDALKNAEPAQ